jgi:hypothetical protein
MALVPHQLRSLFDTTMKNLFESGTRELMTHVIMGNVEIVTSELT